MSYIVTHPAKPHFDEVKTCCILVAQYPNLEKICRREPTQEELDDPTVWVLDTGERYEPDFRNFDHHKELFPSTDCCLSLVLSYLGASDMFQEFFGWYTPKVIRDCKGLEGVSRYFDIDPKVAGRLMSNPFEQWVLEEFGAQTVITPKTFIWEVMYRVGRGLFMHLDHLRTRLKDYASFGTIVDGGGLKGLFMPIMDQVERGAFGMDTYRRKEHPEIEFTITPDTRGDGYSLYRYDGVLLDFRKIEKDPRIKFVHNSGFTASTHKSLPLEELLELVHDSAILYIK